MNDEAIRRLPVLRFDEGGARSDEDDVAREEPLEIRVGGVPLAVVMRTPGADLDLVTGFLLTEGIVASPAEIERVRHCNELADPEAEDNVVLVTLAAGRRLDLERFRRNLFASSSCGVCGKATLDNALAVAPPLEDETRFRAPVVYEMPGRLRAEQRVFDATGGLHGAGLFTTDGTLVAVREDVGRHNAVDKLLGDAARRGDFPLGGYGLIVSGRVSFEIVQKALAARIPLVAAVSAPSSLAADLACRSGMSLVGFLRGRRMNVYGRSERVVGSGA